MASTDNNNTLPSTEEQPQEFPLTMWIILRKDLVKTHNYTTGALIAQASHASSAVLWTHAKDPKVQSYMSKIDTMHKVILEVKNESALIKLGELLKERQIDHYSWIEQPENFITCIATKPYRKPDVGDAFKKCQLFRS